MTLQGLLVPLHRNTTTARRKQVDPLKMITSARPRARARVNDVRRGSRALADEGVDMFSLQRRRILPPT
jgi:hypothetical protein